METVVSYACKPTFQHTSKGLRIGLRALSGLLGRKPHHKEVEMLLRRLGLPFEHQSAFDVMDHNNSHVSHSFKVRLGHLLMYVCEYNGDGSWMVL